jgi:hypothetical protein
VLKVEGFAELSRRFDEEGPDRPRPTIRVHLNLDEIARAAPPEDLGPREKAARLFTLCTKLGAEVSNIEALRENYQAIDNATNTLEKKPTINGERMIDRVRRMHKSLDPNDPGSRLTGQYTLLRNQYTASMDQLIVRDADLNRRGVRSYDTLVARHGEATGKWKSQQARYPLARAERERVCEESRLAQAESERTQAQSASPLKSISFRLRIERSVDVEVIIGAALEPVLQTPYHASTGSARTENLHVFTANTVHHELVEW